MRVLKVPIELQLVISKACWYLYFHLKSLYHFSQQKKTILGWNWLQAKKIRSNYRNNRIWMSQRAYGGYIHRSGNSRSSQRTRDFGLKSFYCEEYSDSRRASYIVCSYHNRCQRDWGVPCLAVRSTFGSMSQSITIAPYNDMKTGIITYVPASCEIKPTINGNNAPPELPNADMMVMVITWVLRGTSPSVVVNATISG